MTMLEERVSSIEGAYDHLATKSDVQELRGEMRATAAELRGELNTATERLQGEIESSKQELRAEFISEIRASEIRVIKWVSGMMVGTALGIVTATAALLRLFLQ